MPDQHKIRKTKGKDQNAKSNKLKDAKAEVKNLMISPEKFYTKS